LKFIPESLPLLVKQGRDAELRAMIKKIAPDYPLHASHDHDNPGDHHAVKTAERCVVSQFLNSEPVYSTCPRAERLPFGVRSNSFEDFAKLQSRRRYTSRPCCTSVSDRAAQVEISASAPSESREAPQAVTPPFGVNAGTAPPRWKLMRRLRMLLL